MNNDSLNLLDITEVVKKHYVSPTLHFIEPSMELSFLQSNLEPIDGGDDPDIDW